MKLNPNFKFIQPEDDDLCLVNDLEVFYHYDEADILLERLVQARSAEADGYMVAQALGDTAFQAYFQDTIDQISAVIDSVVPIAAENLVVGVEEYLINHSV